MLLTRYDIRGTLDDMMLILCQLAQQFVASLHFINSRHDLQRLGPDDKIQDALKGQVQEGRALEGAIQNEVNLAIVDALPADEFKAGMIELSRDLILKE